MVAGCLLVVVTACNALETRVTRVVDAHTETGEFVSARAYALSLEASLARAGGDLAGAERALRAALDEDDSDAGLWARLGGVRCERGLDAAPEEQRAARLDPELSSVWEEAARCALRQGRARDALDLARRAAELEPGRDELTLLYVEAAARAGKPEQARAWHDAWRAKRGEAQPVPPLDALTTALAHGDERAVRRAALAAHLTPGEVALRAAVSAPAELARRLAERAAAAAPEDADAWIALALVRDDPPPPPRLSAASALGRRALELLVERRLGHAAAASLRGASSGAQ